MLAPKDFAAAWAKGLGGLVCFAAASVEQLAIAAEDKAFLRQAGLPTDAAPFLTFDVPGSGELPTAADLWGLGDEFRRYRVIGADGSGNPIALDENHRGEVVCLDHENRFTRALMNTSIPRLAQSLLAYRKLVEDTQAEFGPDAFLDGRTSMAARQELRHGLRAIDPEAMEPGGFWYGQLQILDANAG